MFRDDETCIERYSKIPQYPLYHFTPYTGKKSFQFYLLRNYAAWNNLFTLNTLSPLEMDMNLFNNSTLDYYSNLYNDGNYDGYTNSFQSGAEKESLELLPDQVDHVNLLEHYMKVNYFIVRDTSGTGSGKSICAMKLSERLNLPIFLVATRDINQAWEDKYNQFKTTSTLKEKLTYEALGGKTNKKEQWITLKHGYLIRRDEMSVQILHKGTIRETTKNFAKHYFKITEKLLNVIRSGVIFVFDEVHKIKNVTISSKAALAIIKAVLDPSNGNHSRVIFLSASPMDKDTQAINIFRLLGALTLERPFDTVPTYGEGYIQEALLFCNKWFPYSKEEMGLILSEHSYPVDINYAYTGAGTPANSKDKGYKSMLFEVLIDVVFLNITSTISSTTKDVYRGFFQLDYDGTHTNTNAYASAVAKLSEALAIARNRNANKIDIFKIINAMLQEMEAACVDAMCQFTLLRLKTDPYVKVVNAFTYKNNMWKFEQFFESRGIVVLEISGDVKSADRAISRKKFQGGTHTIGKESSKKSIYYDPDEFRILAMTASSGSTGIDLNDLIVGGISRKVIENISPTYSIITMQQCAGRVRRKTVTPKFDEFGQRMIDSEGRKMITETWSASEVYIFFGIGSYGAIATGILNSLYEKAIIVRRSLKEKESEEGGRIFPGEYPRYFQGIGYIDEANYMSVNPDSGRVHPIDTADILKMSARKDRIRTIEGPMSQEILELLAQSVSGVAINMSTPGLSMYDTSVAQSFSTLSSNVSPFNSPTFTNAQQASTSPLNKTNSPFTNPGVTQTTSPFNSPTLIVSPFVNAIQSTQSPFGDIPTPSFVQSNQSVSPFDRITITPSLPAVTTISPFNQTVNSSSLNVIPPPMGAINPFNGAPYNQADANPFSQFRDTRF